MVDAASRPDPEAPDAVPEEAVVEVPRPSFTKLAVGFWRGEQRGRAWGLTVLLVIFVLAGVAVSYGINRWQARFFDALEGRHIGEIYASILLFAALAIAGVIASFALTTARIGLQIEWRRWLTGVLVGRWLGDRNYYKLNVAVGDHDNPEARMSEDVRLALEPIVDLSIGLLNAVLAAATFLGVLAVVGGAVAFDFGGGRVEIPYAFVLVAVVYAVVMSAVTFAIGRPLIGAVEAKNGAEADLRFEMTRVRESAESIALIAGEEEERRLLDGAIANLMRRWWTISTVNARLFGLINANTVLLPVVPLLVGAGKYIESGMSLGSLMQTAAAFVQVQLAFNWFLDNFIRLAEWRASANRVMGLVASIEVLDQTLAGDDGSQITIVAGDGDALKLTGVSVRRDDGTVVIDEADSIIRRGERVMVSGESGTGKSTLIRAIAGLWPWGRGEIVVPAAWSTMFLPQTPYLPLGTLRAALSYPSAPDGLETEQALAILERIGLGHLADRLDDEDRWDHVLSGGERQRIAFARVLIARPDLVVMDESTSALDEESQTKIMTAFLEDLPDVTLISVAHRPSLAAFHGRTLSLRRETGRVRLVRGGEATLRPWRGIRRVFEDLARVQVLSDPSGTERNRSGRVV